MTTITTNFSNDEIFVQFVENENGLKHGPYVKYFNDPHVPEESLNYVNGLLEGKCLRYNHVDGRVILVESAEYKAGKLHGIRKTWEETSGKPKTIETYSEGKKDGEYIEYYVESGTIHKKYNYFKDDFTSGSKAWYKDGKLKMNFTDKICYWYNQAGQVIQKETYDDNLHILRLTLYCSDGSIFSELEYKNGNKRRATLYKTTMATWFSTVPAKKIVDFEKRTITTISQDNPYERQVYDIKEGFLKTEKLDDNGNVVPSFWSIVKDFFIKTKRELIDEEVQLINKND